MASSRAPAHKDKYSLAPALELCRTLRQYRNVHLVSSRDQQDKDRSVDGLDSKTVVVVGRVRLSHHSILFQFRRNHKGNSRVRMNMDTCHLGRWAR